MIYHHQGVCVFILSFLLLWTIFNHLLRGKFKYSTFTEPHKHPGEKQNANYSKTDLSCAFVANYPHLKLGYAKEIDQHDRVFRSNDFWKKTCEYGSCSEVYGNKTTHVFLNSWRTLKIEGYIEDVGTFPWQHCFFRPVTNNSKFYSPEEMKHFNCTAYPPNYHTNAVEKVREKGEKIQPSRFNNQTLISPTTGFLAWFVWSSECTTISFYGYSDVQKKKFWEHHKYEIEHIILKEAHQNAVWVI